MTLASSTLLCNIMRLTDNYVKRAQEISAGIFWESIHWTCYFLAPMSWFLLTISTQFVHDIILVPKYAWDLLWHPDGRSIFQMLCNPNGDGPLKKRYYSRGLARQDDNLVTKWTWKVGTYHRRKSRSRDQRRSDRSKLVVSKRIVGYDSNLCMFSHYQMDKNNINKCENGGSSRDENSSIEAHQQAMAFTHYYASTFFATIKIFHIERPKEPPDGFLAEFMVLMFTVGIFSCLTILGTARLMAYRKPKLKRKRHKHKRSAAALARRRANYLARKISKIPDYLTSDDESMSASEGASLKGDIFYGCSDSEGECIGIPTEKHESFTTSLADADLETLNIQIPFDTDSVFFVCDNSTTGHICNDIRKFVPGTIRNTMRRLTTANGTGPCLQEGTARIHLVDDNSKRHVFLLENCIYLPDSPVNLLSTRRLAEKFLDANGNPDEETKIVSRYSTHTLSWCFGKYQKTFPTPVSGLPELLFDEGFEAFQSYCTELGSPIPSYASFGSTVVPYDQDEIDCDSNLFMADESIKFNDGQGKQEIVTYLGPKEHAKVMKHCIKDSEDSSL